MTSGARSIRVILIVGMRVIKDLPRSCGMETSCFMFMLLGLNSLCCKPRSARRERYVKLEPCDFSSRMNVGTFPVFVPDHMIQLIIIIVCVNHNDRRGTGNGINALVGRPGARQELLVQ